MEENRVHIPDGWIEITQLGNLSKVYNGLNGKKKDDFGTGEPYIPYVNVFKNSKVDIAELDYVKVKVGERQNAIEYGDIIFTTSSETIEEVGMTAVFLENSGKYLLNSFCFILRLNNKKWLVPQFSQYLFRSQNVRYSISLLGQGSTRYNLSKTRLLKELKFLIPSDTSEQTQIATILSKIDEAIFQTGQLIGKHNRIKTGLMQDLLAKGIDKHGNIRSEATHEFKDSPLGRIPKEWEVSPLNQLCNLIVDCKNRTSPFVEKSDFPVIRTSNIKEGKLVWEDMKYTDLKSYKIWTERAIPSEDDVIITREAPLGQVLKIPSGISPVLGQRTMLFRLDKSKLLPDFLVNSILTEKAQLYLHSLSGGSTVHHLKVGEVKTILIQHPKSPIEQHKIQEILIKEDNEIKELTLKLSKLQSLKTGLMQDLLSGKVRVNHLVKETVIA